MKMDDKVIYFEDIFEHLKTIISDEPMAFYISTHQNANGLWLHLPFSDYSHLLYECEHYDLRDYGLLFHHFHYDGNTDELVLEYLALKEIFLKETYEWSIKAVDEKEIKLKGEKSGIIDSKVGD